MPILATHPGRENRQRLQFNQVGTIFAILLQTWEEQASDAQFGQKDDKKQSQNHICSANI